MEGDEDATVAWVPTDWESRISWLAPGNALAAAPLSRRMVGGSSAMGRVEPSNEQTELRSN